MTTHEIDNRNNQAWNLKYTDTTKAFQYASIAHDHAKIGGYPKGLAYAHLILAFCNFQQSTNEKAIQELLIALDYFENTSPEWRYVVALYLKGNLHEGFGDYDNALEFCQHALRIAETIHYIEGIADTHAVIGQLYTGINDFNNALAALEKSLLLRKRLNDSAAVASTLNRIARIYTNLSEFQKAEAYYREGIALRKELGLTSALAWSYVGIAGLFEKMKKLNEAMGFYNEALQILTEKIDNRCYVHSILGKAIVHTKQKNKDSALKLLNEALRLSQSIGSKPITADVYQAMANLHESCNNYTEAYQSFKKYHEIKEEVLNEQTMHQINQLQTNFTIEQVRNQSEIYRLKHVELKEAYKEIHDSINYAHRIQTSILPNEKQIKALLPESFIFFRPHTTVSGDFYFLEKADDKIFFSAADSTGHGIPGGFMSMLGYYILSQAINEAKLRKPNEILSFLDENINKILRQSENNNGVKDGIDLAFCALDKNKMTLEYAGANNSLYLIRKKGNHRNFKQFESHILYEGEHCDLIEVKSDNLPIGGNVDGIVDQYTLHTFNVEKSDTIYLFSDGYADQFGGPGSHLGGKKFKYKQLKQLLISVHHLEMQQQHDEVAKAFDVWKGDIGQTDDVIVFGVRIT